MENFLIPPEDCLILKAFKETQSLREAALALQCDPSGLTRRVQHISSEYGAIQKVNNRWQLTSVGIALVAWTEESIQSQKKTLSGKNRIRIASTMWIGEEVLIPNLPDLKNYFDQNISFLFSNPGKGFEAALIEGSVDFVIACHPPENPEIEHKKVFDEEWVIIAPSSWGLKKSTALLQLKKRPFIRHSEMNTDLFIPEISAHLQEADVAFDYLIGIRSAVKEGIGWSIVPKLLVKQYLGNHDLTEISYNFATNDRKVCVWWLRNRYDSRKISHKISHWVKDSCS
ncbi:MAG: LysR family transcriptional regulator [Bacteriovorax sp.]